MRFRTSYSDQFLRLHFLPVVLLLAYLPATAQPPAPTAGGMEIRGVVLEPETNQPVAGADVVLYFRSEEPPTAYLAPSQLKTAGTAKTDAAGGFLFRVDKLGYYSASTRKDGYDPPQASARDLRSALDITLTREAPVKTVQLYLMWPGQLSGIVLDAATHQPAANIQVTVRAVMTMNGRRTFTGGGVSRTGADGVFVVSSLPPGSYVVDVDRTRSMNGRVIAKFTGEDAKVVDQDYMRTVWPGVPVLEQGLAVPVRSGMASDVGALPMGKTAYYRVHVTLPASTCAAGTTMAIYEQGQVGMQVVAQNVACAGDFLLTGFAPGAYTLTLMLNPGNTDTRAVAAIPVVITDRNAEATAQVRRGVSVAGNLVTADGAKAPDFTKAMINIRSADVPMIGGAAAAAESDGQFRLPSVIPGRSDLSVSGLGPGYYVKEVRYNGTALPWRTVTVDASAAAHAITVVVDDKPASISGTVTRNGGSVDRAYVVLARWPLPADEPLRPVGALLTDVSGAFQFGSLAPGEYRMTAFGALNDYATRQPGALEGMLAQAPKIQLAQGATQNVTVAVTGVR